MAQARPRIGCGPLLCQQLVAWPLRPSFASRGLRAVSGWKQACVGASAAGCMGAGQAPLACVPGLGFHVCVMLTALGVPAPRMVAHWGVTACAAPQAPFC